MLLAEAMVGLVRKKLSQAPASDQPSWNQSRKITVLLSADLASRQCEGKL